MNPIKSLRPVLMVLGFVLFGALCAMAQAEVDPDHFDRPPQQTVSIQKAHMKHQRPMAVQGAPAMKARPQGGISGGLSAHGKSAGRNASVTKIHTKAHDGEKKRPRVVTEARRYGAA